MKRRKSTTLKDLAEELGLSVYTVSKALRGLPGMSEETRKAIIDLAHKKKYRTKKQEHALAVEQIPLYSEQTKRFKYLTSGTNDMHQLIMEGLQEVLSKFNHIIEPLFVSEEVISAEQFKAFLDKHNLQYMDGLFIPPNFPSKLINYLVKTDIPQIHIYYPPSHAAVDSVIWDVEQAIIDSVTYLHDMGHTNILYVGDTTKTKGYVVRWQAFQQTLGELGIPLVPHQHLIDTNGKNNDWVEHFAMKVRDHQPTAILCAIGYNAAWIYYACSKIGLSIPQDISLVSVDVKENDMMPDLTRPILLVKETGRRAAERMLWRLANPSSPYEHVRLKGHFFTGGTVRKRDK